MKERWRVEHGTLLGSWRILRGEEVICVFWSWMRALTYAREEAIRENLNIVSIEVCS